MMQCQTKHFNIKIFDIYKEISARNKNQRYFQKITRYLINRFKFKKYLNAINIGRYH